MTERERFLTAVYANPDDDNVRLVFADWLDENGDPDRAEFIRAQIRSARRPRVYFPAPQPREDELLAAHREDWIRDSGGAWDLPDGYLARMRDWAAKVPTQRWRASGNPPWIFRRGFPDHLDFTGARDVPVVDWLYGIPAFPVLRGLYVHGNNMGGIGASRLAACPKLNRLAVLELGGNGIGPAGAAAIAAGPHWGELTWLSLGDNGIGPAGTAAIAGRSWQKLVELNLADNAIGAAGVAALIGSQGLNALTTVIVPRNRLGREQLAALKGRFKSVRLMGSVPP